MVSRSPQLRVGVPNSLRQLSSSSGWGRMWRSVLPELAKLVPLGFWDNPRRSRFRQPPDVWLHDGHQGPLWVPEPSVVHLQEASWRHPSTEPLLAAKFLTQYENASRLAVERALRVITPSESSRQQIIEEYGLDPAHVVIAPLGVDLALFRPARPGAGDIISRAGGDPSRPYVLFVSTVHPRKNLAALRAAMSGLARRGLPHGLVVAASRPPDRDDAKALFDEAGSDLPGAPGRVVLLRDLSDVELAALMAGAAAFCLPSLMEGFGLTALEAMACGVPVVVSNRGSLPEVVGDAGVVSEPDAEALEEALHGLLTDPERLASLRQAGLQRSLAFTWQATAQGWYEALRQAVPTPQARILDRLVPASGLAAQVVDYGIRLPVRRRRSVRHNR
ncbi:MAG: glycosyltransferase family 4 protein [Actinomycetota bacterium]|nr:glycosyltransferase family 4 protein [Actinomycetota bacterium]